MKKFKKIAIAVALLGSASAFAQTTDYSAYYNPSWYIAPSVNVSKSDDTFGVDHNGSGGGLRFGKAISPTWDLQFGPTFSRSSNNGRTYEQTTLGADALYMFSRNRFRPFVLMGAGVQQDKVRSPGLNDSSTSPYINAGLGFQYSFTDRFAFQADVRRVHGFLRDNAFNSKRSNNDYVTASLIYYFDRPAPRQVTRVVAEPAPVIIAAPAPVPAPMPAPAPAPRFERITLSATELFAFDSATLRMPQPKLDAIADALSGSSGSDNLTITGYTDRLGSDQYNQKLSQERADAVKAYLAGKGINASRMNAQGKGESNPVVQCSQKNRAALIQCLEPNRRVEVEQITIERRVQ
ncbi:MAG: OmpA family protein [Pseudomonadota bacterium]